jgi:hypothetical protein
LFLRTGCADLEVDIATKTQVILLVLPGADFADSGVVDSGVVPSHVSFEAVGADGEWSACILGEEDNAATATSELPVSDPIQPESLPEDTDQHSKQRVEMRAFAPANQIPDLAISLPPVGITPDLDLSAIEIPRDDGLNPQLGLAFETDQHTDFEIGDYFAVSPVIFDFGQFYRDALQDLPFQRFQNALKIKGVCYYNSSLLLAVNHTNVL